MTELRAKLIALSTGADDGSRSLRERLIALSNAYAADVTMAPEAFALAAARLALEDAESAVANGPDSRYRAFNAIRALRDGLEL